jgi:hypothetical protein
VRWVAAHVPIRVDPALASDPEESAEAAEVAFDAWGGLRGVPELRLDGDTQRVPGYSLTGDNENGVYRVASLPIDGVALAVTVSTYRQSDGELLDADVLVATSGDVGLLSEEPEGRELRTYDLGSLLAHESGHVLGLGETEDDEAATMWPRLHRGDTGPRTLEADDEAGALELYAGAGLHTQSCGVQGPLGRLGGGASVLFAFGLAMLAAVIRRRQSRRALAGVALLAVVLALGASERVVKADDGLRGRAHLVDVRWERGLLVSEFDVTTAGGHERLVVLGGARDGVVQQVGNGLPPADGAQVWLGVDEIGGRRTWVNLDEPGPSSAARPTPAP